MLIGELLGPQEKTMTYTQLRPISEMAVIRAHTGRGPVVNGSFFRAIVQATASGAPATNTSPAKAASGLAANAAVSSPLRNAVAALVVPQVGHGRPVNARKTQGRREGTRASHTGRRATADTAAANHRSASWRSSFVTARILTERRLIRRAHP